MATPPPKKTLTLEDVPGAPGWLEKLLGPLNTALRASAEALERGLTFRENFSGEVRQVDVTPPEEWFTPTLALGWSSSVSGTDPQPFSLRKTFSGKVEARGRLDWTSGGTPSSAQLISSLASMYAPSHREVFDIYGFDSALAYKPSTVSINAAGEIRWETPSGGFRNMSFSGDVWWTAADSSPPRWASPLEVRLGTPQQRFVGRPGAVLCLSARRKQSPDKGAVVSAIDWSPLPGERGEMGIRIHRVWGLAPGVGYTLTLLVLPE